ncbi:MAG: leucine-rich repeat domain-containing protein [Spirochaetaceae bacterium]|jgi:hypothetical protein|nr:leucine-rich repeat domain-containing protein [Spirochaetaceae bacterium]
MKKPFLRALCAAALALATAASLDAKAQAEKIPAGLRYEQNRQGGAAITGYTGTDTALVIPARIDGKPVTVIGNYAFAECRSLRRVTIPAGVIFIESNAFLGCTGLRSVIIPGSVTSIGGGAFYGCSSLRRVTVLDGVTAIEDYAFDECSNLTSVTIGGSVTAIGDYAFDECSSLTSVTFAAGSRIHSENFSDRSPFPGDLREKYLAGGGAGGAGR